MVLKSRLKLLRENIGLNQKEMAKELNMSYTTYNNYENGIRTPDIEILKYIANYFNCTIDYLVGRTDKPNLELIDKNLPQELIDSGIQAIKVFKGLKVEDLTPQDIQYLIEFAEKVQKNRP